MKLLQLNRRSSSRNLDSDSSSNKSMFWVAIHSVCCLVSLVLGFRFSRLVLFLLFSTATPQTLTVFNDTTTVMVSSSSRVQVGRHGIRIRPWPHPDPVEVMKAHRIMDRVQAEQRLLKGLNKKALLIAVTPTYVRTFQALHLTGVMHSLMNLPYPLLWIVVEAGTATPTNETARILSSSRGRLRVIHVPFHHRVPLLWEARHKLEARMRLHALRIVRAQRLDGVVMFADDSNMHSLELFDEILNVKWFGALSIGILAHSTTTDQEPQEEESTPLPIQGPACNSSNKLVGWHTFNSIPYLAKRAISIDDRGPVLPMKFEWSGFVLNSRLLWKDAPDNKPQWVKDLDSVGEDLQSPLSLLTDTSVVEPLGDCGRKVMLWWLRVEARTDSKFPLGWIIKPPLEVTVPAKRTPWPDVPPELPTTEKVTSSQEELTEKRPTKNRASRSKHTSRSKRKREPRVISTQVAAGQSE